MYIVGKHVVIGIYTGRNYIPIVMPSLLKYYTHCVQYTSGTTTRENAPDNKYT